MSAANPGAAIGVDEPALRTGPEGLTHTADAIQQTVIFRAPRQRVYGALTEASRFDAVTRLSDALALVSAKGAAPTAISSQLGGAFTLFGGYITGRHLVMRPGERLVEL